MNMSTMLKQNKEWSKTFERSTRKVC